MQYDYIIIGQGLSGSFMSYFLMQEGQKVLVIDEFDLAGSSRVASGLINPVTGKRMVTTWMAEQLLPFAWQTYNELGRQLNTSIISQTRILDFHPLRESRDMFDSRMAEGTPYLNNNIDQSVWGDSFRLNYGIGIVEPCMLVDLQAFLPKWRLYLLHSNALLEEHFDWNSFSTANDGIRYKDITAGKIILCDGTNGFGNPYFSLLPYSSNKGEALIVSIPGLPRNNIYKQGIKIVPWKDDLFWVGASFDWKYNDLSPTPAYREKVKSQLDYWLKLPYKVEDHIASERPSTVGQTPFVGLHPVHNNIGILNGMGTKGCSLAPYLAHRFAQHLVQGSQLLPEADIARFNRILTR